jgi:hypothetical protein
MEGVVQNYIAPKSSLILFDFASGFSFSTKKCMLKSAAFPNCCCMDCWTTLLSSLDHPKTVQGGPTALQFKCYPILTENFVLKTNHKGK